MFTIICILALILIWVLTVAYYDSQVRRIKRKSVAQLKRSFHERRQLRAENFLLELERDAWIVKHQRHAGRIFDGLAKDRPAEAYELHVHSVGRLLDVKL